MSESPHSASPKPRVDASSAGGDDKKGARRGAIFIGLVLVAYIVYLIFTGQMAQFIEALSTVDMSWIVVACLCMVLYFIFGVAAYAIAVWLDPESPVGIRDLISVEASGVFFGNLTPMMVGGTPAQIYRLTKAGQPVGEAGATQFTRYIVFQVGLVVWGAILLAVRLPFFTDLYGDMTLLCLFSFGGHVVLLTALFVVSLCPGFVTKLATWAIGFVERIGGESDRTRGWRDYVNNEIYSFSHHFKHAAAHLSSMGITMLVTMAQLAFFYMVPYFVLLAFGNHDVDFLSCLAAGAFIQLLSSAVPLPGGTGGAEGGFALFLGHFFGASATAGYLVWRLITFFAPTILTAPLLGLKSARHASIHARWDRIVHGGERPQRAASGTRRVPTPEGAAQPVSAAPKRPRRQQVRQTAGGITVSPSNMRRKKK
ncbi:lysylphosphatidylglycerol synthase transmembrane domain-containing protein [Enorma phocaeensis]|uniref:Flippase-like domain-containing protein n=1 Tax=Enorma phocaeensis TaxID=1871019 RepID=A0A921IUU4_9ACTN|nr:lysylphosphatidylglycerol synthase transmembrane domain-containing protein [Enorma phocaeensis]HJG36412.1 flippase-like domain-containing protein [Enorma phocaeensis]